MGTPSQSWVKKFVEGKTIKTWETKGDGSHIMITFTNGERLRLVTYGKHPTELPGVERIVTPFNTDGTVKQTIEFEE